VSQILGTEISPNVFISRSPNQGFNLGTLGLKAAVQALE